MVQPRCRLVIVDARLLLTPAPLMTCPIPKTTFSAASCVSRTWSSTKGVAGLIGLGGWRFDERSIAGLVSTSSSRAEVDRLNAGHDPMAKGQRLGRDIRIRLTSLSCAGTTRVKC